MAFDHIQVQKKAIARAYNKRTKYKSFGEGDLFWKNVLSIGSKDPKFGKWSPNWDDPYLISKVVGKGHISSKIKMVKNTRTRLMVIF